MVAERLGVSRGAMVRWFGVEEVWVIYDLQVVLEGHAARGGSGRIDERGMARLEELSEEMERLSARGFEQREAEIRLLAPPDNELHGLIIEVKCNRPMIRCIHKPLRVGYCRGRPARRFSLRSCAQGSWCLRLDARYGDVVRAEDASKYMEE